MGEDPGVDGWSGAWPLRNVLGREIRFRACRPGPVHDLWVAVAARVQAWGSQRREQELDEPPECIIWQAAPAETQPSAVIGVGQVQYGGGQSGNNRDGHGVVLQQLIFGDALREAPQVLE
jgi:hypothetical protein